MSLNLLDFVSHAKTADRKGKEFEFAGTGALFRFRALNMDELSQFVAAGQSEVAAMAEQINKLLALDTVLGWQNLTQELACKLMDIDPISESDPLDLIPFDPGKKDESNGLVRAMAANAEFAVFVSTSVLSATNEAKISAEKKTAT